MNQWQPKAWSTWHWEGSLDFSQHYNNKASANCKLSWASRICCLPYDVSLEWVGQGQQHQLSDMYLLFVLLVRHFLRPQWQAMWNSRLSDNALVSFAQAQRRACHSTQRKRSEVGGWATWKPHHCDLQMWQVYAQAWDWTHLWESWQHFGPEESWEWIYLFSNNQSLRWCQMALLLPISLRVWHHHTPTQFWWGLSSLWTLSLSSLQGLSNGGLQLNLALTVRVLSLFVRDCQQQWLKDLCHDMGASGVSVLGNWGKQLMQPRQRQQSRWGMFMIGPTITSKKLWVTWHFHMFGHVW